MKFFILINNFKIFLTNQYVVRRRGSELLSEAFESRLDLGVDIVGRVSLECHLGPNMIILRSFNPNKTILIP